MARDTGFFQLRRGLWEHVRDGRMTITEALAFIYIGTQADTRNGIWKGSAKSLSGELGIPERTARDVLEKMEHGDYIRRFAVPGRHACYPILVHKFLITSGTHDGKQLNALASTSPDDLAYFPREQDGRRNGKRGAAQKRSKTEEKRKKPAPAPPSDPRYPQFFDFAYETYSAKHGSNPLWTGKDFNGLKSRLKAHSAGALSLDRLKQLWRNYLESSELFTVKQGDGLAYFCANLDKFSDGPIKERGKTDARDALAQSIANSGLDANGRLKLSVVH
jgi:hypothetical protein